MMFSICTLAGVVIGLVLTAALGLLRPATSTQLAPAAGLTAEPESAGQPAWQAWIAIGTGVVGLIGLTVGLAGDFSFLVLFLALSIPIAGLVVAITLLSRGMRGWAAWTGFAVSALPVAFWLLFVFGEVTGPAH